LSLEAEARSYLAEVMAGLEASHSESAPQPQSPEQLAEEIFGVVTSRQFCYLSRTKTAPYRPETVRLLHRRIETGEPFRFIYDIGPGYHASLAPGELDLRFDVGLSELLIFYQINSLCRRVAELYPPGGHFWLFIDNICGLRTNDIPLERTEGYCARLRELIRETGLADRVDLIVESEEFSLEEYDRLLAELEVKPLVSPPSADAIENVERFLGRRCSVAEAAERIERYQRTGFVTDTLIDRLVRGVHMTQRATGATLGFRPFPGGDARTQCGEVVLGGNPKGRLHPFLLTSRNVDAYELIRLRYPDLLPATVKEVILAESARPDGPR
jgi:hypothetical protein